MAHNELPQDVKNWLYQRGISQTILDKYQIGWDGTHILIPIFSPDNKFLFNKKRRSPFTEDGPKYSYDKGGSVQLFGRNHHFPNPNEVMFLVEGELDALRLESLHFAAISSTGGAGSFNPEWIPYLSCFTNLYVCFDRDDAGFKGMLKIQQALPRAKMLELPEYVAGKDITDYFSDHQPDHWNELLNTAKTYWIPQADDTDDKKMAKKKETEFRSASNILNDIENEKRGKREPTRMVEIFREYCVSKYAEYKKFTKKKIENVAFGSDLEKAKQVPIDSIIKFNRDLFAPCVWHNEKTGSMKFYPEDNHVFCFGCHRRGSPIDVVMARDSVDIKGAVKIILNK